MKLKCKNFEICVFLKFPFDLKGFFLSMFSLILNVEFVSVDTRHCRQQPSYHNFSNAFNDRFTLLNVVKFHYSS